MKTKNDMEKDSRNGEVKGGMVRLGYCGSSEVNKNNMEKDTRSGEGKDEMA